MQGGSGGIFKHPRVGGRESFRSPQPNILYVSSINRISILDRLGEPVHKDSGPVNDEAERGFEYSHDDCSNDFDNSDRDVTKAASQLYQHQDMNVANIKKLKREKRDKKDKKEKKKLKELRKLEKKLKKLTAKKRQKKSGRVDSNASDTEEDYDDRIEYFMSEEDEEDHEASSMQHIKESKKLKQSKSSPKIAVSKKRSVSSDSNKPKKEDKKEDDGDDEDLFAFFEKPEGQTISTANSISGKRSELTKKSNTPTAASLPTVVCEGTSKKRKDAAKHKGVSPNDELSLMSKMKKKNEKTMQRMKEIEEDKLFHR